MSKGRTFRRKNRESEQEVSPSGSLLYRTLSGYNVPYGPVSVQDIAESQINIKADFLKRGEPIEEPEYTITIELTGEEQSYPLNADSLVAQNKDGSVNPEKSAEREALWRAHKDAVRRMDTELRLVMTDIILDGILVKEPSRDEPEMQK